jgi:serine protease Do
MSRAVLGLCFFLVAMVAALVGLVAGGGGTAGPSLHAARLAEPSFAEVVERVNAAVVHIAVVDNGKQVPPEIADFPGGQGPRRGEGSGFVIDPDGYILTNHHVVASPARIRVRLADRRELAATLVGSDPNTDLALIKVEATALPVLPLGDSDRLRVGEWVCAIGNPYRFDHSVTVGVVSSKGRKIYDQSFDSYIQTDAAINPGNSGGPLINVNGEAIGINSAVTAHGQGIGFAVPINVARPVLEQLRAHGHVTRGYLGVQLQELDPDLQRLIGLPESRGALVVDVQKGRAGEAAGLKRYDVILAVSGQPIEDGDQLVRTIAARPPGSAVTLDVFRDGRGLSLEARLAERVGNDAVHAVEERIEPVAERGDRLGLAVTELSQQMASTLSVPSDRRGVVVEDVVGLASGTEALDHGDVIVEVNRQATPTVAAYRRVVAALSAAKPAWLFVYRPRPGGGPFLAKIEVEAEQRR